MYLYSKPLALQQHFQRTRRESCFILLGPLFFIHIHCSDQFRMISNQSYQVFIVFYSEYIQISVFYFEIGNALLFINFTLSYQHWSFFFLSRNNIFCWSVFTPAPSHALFLFSSNHCINLNFYGSHPTKKVIYNNFCY